MANFMRKRRGGFTLIELMIVVAIVAILALLAIFGVSKFLATAKTAEATNSIGQINRNAIASYERETAPAQLLVAGNSSTNNAHALCADSTSVPAAIAAVKNRKYQPSQADYASGNQTQGWACLKFEMREPQYYAYMYKKGAVANPGNVAIGGAPPAIPATGWSSAANGDLDGDGTTASFLTGGNVAANGQITTFTEIFTNTPEE